MLYLHSSFTNSISLAFWLAGRFTPPPLFRRRFPPRPSPMLPLQRQRADGSRVLPRQRIPFRGFWDTYYAISIFYQFYVCILIWRKKKKKICLNGLMPRKLCVRAIKRIVNHSVNIITMVINFIELSFAIPHITLSRCFKFPNAR